MHQHDTIFSGPKSDLSLNSFILAAKDTYSGIFILADTNTRKVCLPVLQRLADLPDDVKILEVEPGEKSKSFETTIKLWNELAALGADRYSLLICLGGGVICDLGGFVASTYQRGIEFVYIPTSLLGQVDAAIGGKTGINLNQLKNYVGLFSTPKAIFILTEFLQSLPFAELMAGYAEVVKHALLSSEKTFRQLTKQFPDQQSIRNCKEWDPIVSHSVKVKSNVVNSDPTEKGLRKILNFGHTVGHAFESHSLNSGNTTLPHGYAVAMGLIVELCLSVKLSGFPEKLRREIETYLLSMFPFYHFKPEDIPEITTLMGFDKKNKSGNIQMILMKKPGDLITDIHCTTGDIADCLSHYLNKGDSKL